MRKLIFTFAILGMFAPMSFADAYKSHEGIIAEIYDGGQSIKVTESDSLTKERKTVMVSIDPKTRIVGTESAGTLKAGDSVSILASQADENRLSAKQISVTRNN